MPNYLTVAELLKGGPSEAAPLSDLLHEVLQTWQRPITNAGEHGTAIGDSLMALREAAQALAPKGQAAESSLFWRPIAWGRSFFSRGSVEAAPEVADQTRNLAFINASMLDRAVTVAKTLSTDVGSLTHGAPLSTELNRELSALGILAHEHSSMLAPNSSSRIPRVNLVIDKDSMQLHNVAVQKFLSGLESASLAAAPPEALGGLRLGAQAGNAIKDRALSEVEIRRLAALKAVMLDENVRIAHALAQDGMRFSSGLTQSGSEVPGLYPKAEDLAARLGLMREQTAKQAEELLKNPSLRFVT